MTTKALLSSMATVIFASASPVPVHRRFFSTPMPKDTFPAPPTTSRRRFLSLITGINKTIERDHVDAFLNQDAVLGVQATTSTLLRDVKY